MSEAKNKLRPLVAKLKTKGMVVYLQYTEKLKNDGRRHSWIIDNTEKKSNKLSKKMIKYLQKEGIPNPNVYITPASFTYSGIPQNFKLNVKFTFEERQKLGLV